MSIPSMLFYFFGVMAAMSAGGILFTRNVFYGALMLLVCLLSVAGIYVLAFAEFIAVVQLLIYAGGVLVVIIFGIMLTSKISGKPLVVKNSKWGAGLLAGLSFLCMLIYFFSKEKFIQQPVTENTFGGYNPINQIGIELMTNFVAPFEIAGILLLISLVGAAIMASYKKQP